eukprot:1068224-Lingulodinium_polyedra.AAC.1
MGFDTVPADWRGNRHQPGVVVQMVDLTTETGRGWLLALLSEPRAAYVHFAPLCGTFSRAREEQIPQ